MIFKLNLNLYAKGGKLVALRGRDDKMSKGGMWWGWKTAARRQGGTQCLVPGCQTLEGEVRRVSNGGDEMS